MRIGRFTRPAAASRIDTRMTVSPPDRCQLLVSVRSWQELSLVRRLAVAVIDFKEPLAGPLAATSSRLWRLAAEQLATGPPPGPVSPRLSAALGECYQATATAIAGQVPATFAYAKAGPAGVRSVGQLAEQWRLIRRRLPESVALVAVAYADHVAAGCPPPEEIFAAAGDAGLTTWLLDTFVKPTDALPALPDERLLAIQAVCRAANSRWALAGSLTRQRAAHYRRIGLAPDLFAVRGAVCDGCRSGSVVPSKVQAWLDDLASSPAAPDDCY